MGCLLAAALPGFACEVPDEGNMPMRRAVTKVRMLKEVDAWAKQLTQKSNGRLVFKMYPGGVMGDEPDVLRKLRSQQLHGAFFTGYGVGRIFPPARVLEMPFFFKDTNESDFVRDQLMPDIEKGFRQNGYELIGWPEVGFIHFFSKQPILCCHTQCAKGSQAATKGKGD